MTALRDLLVNLLGMIDVMPAGMRALTTALVLAGALTFFEKRIPGPQTQYGQSFRKTALVALLAVPAFVWLAPASRMVVFVEALPDSPSWMAVLWWAFTLTWLAGFTVTASAVLSRQLASARVLRSLPRVDDAKLLARLDHWCARLGRTSRPEVLLAPGDQPAYLLSGTQLVFPAAALRWPVNQQDALIINGLCSLMNSHRRWHRIGAFVACVYWPVRSIQRVHANLLKNLRLAASDLAESCYQDRLGYTRALRQLAQRLKPRAKDLSRTREATIADNGRRVGAVQRCLRALRALMPADDPVWDPGELLAARTQEAVRLWTDPYDRVVLFIGQAVLVAVLVTGVTLRERPPETEERFLMPFGLVWKERFHRNLELQEKVQPQR
ncbi:MAG TPA: hypothetical protein VIS76_04550 [Pseudomonadales bacterium]